MNGIDACTGAGVTASRAARSRASFSGGIRHLIARARAAALESVVEADPVSRFVSKSLKNGILVRIYVEN